MSLQIEITKIKTARITKILEILFLHVWIFVSITMEEAAWQPSEFHCRTLENLNFCCTWWASQRLVKIYWVEYYAIKESWPASELSGTVSLDLYNCISHEICCNISPIASFFAARMPHSQSHCYTEKYLIHENWVERVEKYTN